MKTVRNTSDCNDYYIHMKNKVKCFPEDFKYNKNP